MSFSITKEGDRVVAGIPAMLVVSNRQELKQRVLDELDRGERIFVIDLRQTGYVDSSGLGVLVSLAKAVRDRAGELRLANLSSEVRRIFEMAKLETLFTIEDEGEGTTARQ